MSYQQSSLMIHLIEPTHPSEETQPTEPGHRMQVQPCMFMHFCCSSRRQTMYSEAGRNQFLIRLKWAPDTSSSKKTSSRLNPQPNQGTWSLKQAFAYIYFMRRVGGRNKACLPALEPTWPQRKTSISLMRTLNPPPALGENQYLDC